MTHTPDIDKQVNAAIHGMTERMSVEAGEDKKETASLIAAAPDMLEALELVVGHKGFDIEYIYYRCRLAIRKARGEE